METNLSRLLKFLPALVLGGFVMGCEGNTTSNDKSTKDTDNLSQKGVFEKPAASTSLKEAIGGFRLQLERQKGNNPLVQVRLSFNREANAFSLEKWVENDSDYWVLLGGKAKLTELMLTLSANAHSNALGVEFSRQPKLFINFDNVNPKVGAKVQIGAEDIETFKITKIEKLSAGESRLPEFWENTKRNLTLPLTEKEKIFVGRWQVSEINNAGEYQAWMINRSDHSSSYFLVEPEIDNDGNKVPGKFNRTLIHGLWRIIGNRIYRWDLVIDEEKVTQNDRVLIEYKINSLMKQMVVYEEKDFSLSSQITTNKYKCTPVDKFTEPELLPYNSKESLKKSDILKAY